MATDQIRAGTAADQVVAPTTDHGVVAALRGDDVVRGVPSSFSERPVPRTVASSPAHVAAFASSAIPQGTPAPLMKLCSTPVPSMFARPIVPVLPFDQ